MSDLPLPGQSPYSVDQSLHQTTNLVGKQKIGDFKAVTTSVMRFNDIPQTFTHLEVAVQWRSTRAAFQNTGLRFTINGLSTSYHFSYYGIVNGAVSNGHATNQPWGYLGQTPAALSAAFNASHHLLWIPYYRERSTIKEVLTQNNILDGGVNGHASLTVGNEIAGLATAVTRIDLSDDVAGVFDPAQCKATLYGIL